MALYQYLKAAPKRRLKTKLFPMTMVVSGLLMLGSVLTPFLTYQLKSNAFEKPLISPLSVSAIAYDDKSQTDYNKPESWFKDAPKFAPIPLKITHYTISIPKLGIEKAVVEIGGEDLSKSLIQYSGTALPGQFGNAVIFGHSILPQFFSSKNYKTIFSNLPMLKKGDEVLVDFDGISYHYRVFKIVEVPPKDVTVLEQEYNAAYISLITCVPPGTDLRRLIVKAQLSDY